MGNVFTEEISALLNCMSRQIQSNYSRIASTEQAYLQKEIPLIKVQLHYLHFFILGKHFAFFLHGIQEFLIKPHSLSNILIFLS